MIYLKIADNKINESCCRDSIRNGVSKMNDYRTKLDVDQSVQMMLHECRELMTDHLKQSLPNMMDEIDDVLLDIAVKTTNSNERTKYFNVMHEMRVKRHNIERTCLENFIELFDENLRSGNREMNALEGNTHEEPKDDNVIAMTSTVNKVRSNCHQALLNLDERLCQILDSDVPGIGKNPVSPEIVCQAFYKACELVDTGAEIRLIIFKYFEKYVASKLNDVYLEIDHVIDARGSTVGSVPGEKQTCNEENSNQGYQRIAEVKQTVTSKIQELLAGKHVPDFVSDFLLKHWMKLLTLIYDKNGMNSDAWQHAIETVEDLVWSVGNVSSQEDKDRFDKLWPDLIKRLRNGINMISMSSHEEADFISRLLKHRATLTMLGSLSETRNNGVTLINSEKVEALKTRLKSANEQSDHEKVATSEKVDPNNIGSEDITLPAIKIQGNRGPFMDELLVDNFDIKGFKSDITGD